MDFRVPGKRSLALLLGMGLLLSCGLLAGSADAKVDWLQKGKDLLQGGAATTMPSTPGSLSSDEIGSGLKEALRIGVERVIDRLGKTDGFNADPNIRIPLPQSLEPVDMVLSKTRMSFFLDDLRTKLNRAAEEATPRAKELFWKAIEGMTLEDVSGIYNGPEDAATRYFQGKMTPELADAMRPIVANSLSQVGAVQAYDRVMERYRSIPFVPDAKADLSEHVVDEGIKGIFYYLGQEEAAIRRNPAKRTTELLQKVFSR
jgi:hypothetical protein